MIIYKATFPNGKCYIGQTINSLEIRKSQHLSKAKSCLNILFLNALRKYQNEVKWEIIDTASSREELNYKEKYWIKFYKSFGKNGYNTTDGGEKDYKLSTDTIEKIKFKRKFQKFSEQTRNKLSENLKKRGWSTEEKQKAVLMSKAKRQTTEYKQRLSSIHKGKKFTEEQKIKISLSKGCKPFIILKDGIVLEKFICRTLCAKKYNVSDSKISLCLNGKRKTHKGFTFKYVDSNS